MAEIVVGDIVAKLRIDASAFQQGVQQANTSLQQLSQQAISQTGYLGQLAAAFGRMQTSTQAATTSTAQLTQGMALLNQQAISQTGYLGQLIATLTRMEQAMASVGSTARTAGGGLGSLSTIFQVAGGIGIATTIAAATSALVEFAKSTVDVGTRMEQLRTTFGALAGSVPAGIQQFQQLFQTAQDLGVAFEPLAKGWRTLTAAATQAGLPLEDQRRLLVALTTEARRTGASNEELSRAIVAVAQTASKGVVSMEELRQQLGEALVTSMAAAARGMGRTTEELEKLVSTGSVRFPAFARALTRGFEEMQAASGKMADGGREAFNRLENAMIALKDRIGTTIMPLLVQMTNWATQFVTLLEGSPAFMGTGRQNVQQPAGPFPQDLGMNANQARELTALNSAIARTEQERTSTGAAVLGGSQQDRLARLREQRDELLAAIRLTQDEATAQAKVTAETNKTTGDRQREADYLDSIRKKLQDVQKAEADFRREAAITPQLLGRPTGTPDEQITFARERQQRLGTPLEDLGKLAAQPPLGVTIPADLLQQIRAVDTQYGKLGQTIDTIREKQQADAKAVRDAERAREKAVRDAESLADHQARQRIANEVAEIAEQERKFKQLQQLAAGYLQTKEATDAQTASTLAADLAGTKYGATAQDLNQAIQDSAKVLGQVDTLLAQAASSWNAYQQAKTAATKEDTALQRMGDMLERLRAPREERLGVRLDQLGRDVTTEAGQRRVVALREAAVRQERLNEAARLFEELGSSIGSAWASAFSSIVGGTATVAAAFRQMAQSILQSMAQIAAQEAFRALFKSLGGAISGGGGGGGGSIFSGLFGGDTSGAVSAGGSGFSDIGGAVGGFGDVIQAQSGAIVNRPTHMVVGENASTNPEIILNKPQIQALFQQAMQAAPSAGGQSTGGNQIVIVNVASKEQGEQEAARQRMLGRQVIMNYVTEDLQRGESSQILKYVRLTQR